jgi:hypothetical protein
LGFIQAPSGKTAAFYGKSNRLRNGTEIPTTGIFPQILYSDSIFR